MRFYLPDFLDCFFTFLISLVIFFVISSFYMAMPYSLIFSAVLSITVLLFTVKYLRKKRTKILSTKTDRLLFDKTTFQLSLLSPEKTLKYFAEVFMALKKDVEKHKNRIDIPDEKTSLFFVFPAEGLKKADIIKAYNDKKAGYTAVIFAEKCDFEIVSYKARFGKEIEIIFGEKVFEIIKKANVFPDNPCPETIKKNHAVIFKSLLKKEKSKKFFFLGLTFMLMSFFITHKIYYVICGMLFLIYSLLLRFYGIRTEK